jgi:hypothetical protein
LLILGYILHYAISNVYECNQSDDADFFLDSDPARYRALLFYKNGDDFDYDTDFERVQTIFMDPDDDNWDGESWIEQYSYDINAMRVSINKTANAGLVKAFEVKITPFIILFDDIKDAVEEVINQGIYDRVREAIQESNSGSGHQSSNQNSDGSVTIGGDSSSSGQSGSS